MSDKKNKVNPSTLWILFIYDSPILSSIEVNLAAFLKSKMWYEKDNCNPSYELIRSSTKTSKPTVSKALKLLKDRGWLTIKRGGRETSSSYQMLYPDHILDHLIDNYKSENEVQGLKFYLDDNRYIKNKVDDRIENLKSKRGLPYNAANDENRSIKGKGGLLYRKENDDSEDLKGKGGLLKGKGGLPEVDNKLIDKDKGDKPPPKTPSPKKAKSKNKPKKKTPIPDDFALTEIMALAATSYWIKNGKPHLNVELEFDSFVARSLASGTKNVDWAAAWRTWYVNAVKFDKSNTYTNQQPTPRVIKDL